MKTVLTALKLSESAPEAEALAAVERLRSAGADYQSQATKLIALTGKPTAEEALGVITAWKDAAARVAEVEKTLQTIKAEKREAQVVALVDRGLKEKKIAPAKKDEFLALGRAKNGRKLLKSYLEAASPLVATTKQTQVKDGKVVVTLTDEQKAIAQNLGVSMEDIAKRAAMTDPVVLSMMGPKQKQ